jgi:hypothetical protein
MDARAWAPTVYRQVNGRSTATFFSKLSSNLPWLVRYPFSRAQAFLEMTAFEKKAHYYLQSPTIFDPAGQRAGVLDHRDPIEASRRLYPQTHPLDGDAVARR